MNTRSYFVLLVGVCGAGCDDTQQAIHEESLKTQQELEQAAEDVKAEARRETNEASQDVKAATSAAKRQLNNAAEAIEKKVDEVDKAVADTIRDDDDDDDDDKAE